MSPLLRKLPEKTNLTAYYYSDASIRGTQDKDFGIAVKWDIGLLAGYNYCFVRNYSKRS